MKTDQSHGRAEADCRAELILINGDCTDPTADAPALLLEANGKHGAPSECPGCAGMRGAGGLPATVPRACRGGSVVAGKGSGFLLASRSGSEILWVLALPHRWFHPPAAKGGGEPLSQGAASPLLLVPKSHLLGSRGPALSELLRSPEEQDYGLLMPLSFQEQDRT